MIHYLVLRRRLSASGANRRGLGGTFDQDQPGVAEPDRLKVPRPAPGVNCGTGPARGIAGPWGLALPGWRRLVVPSGLLPPGGRRAGMLTHAYRPQLIGLSTRIFTGWLDVTSDGTAVYAPHV